MLAELPPTPQPLSSSSTSHPAIAPAVPPVPMRRSPRHSHRKLTARAASPRKTRVSRRSSGLGVFALSPKAKGKVLPSFETEVLPSTVPSSSVPPSPVRPPPTFKTSMAAPVAPSPMQLASAFILPPPSPAASFPSTLGDGASFPPLPPLPKLEIPTSSSNASDDSMDATPEPLPSSISSASSSSNLSSAPSASSLSSGVSSSSSYAAPSAPPVLSTPSARPFPIAKPFAQRMVHAYSPAKPSPLSRILMLGASPDSPPGCDRLGALPETDESSSSLDLSVGAHAPTTAPPVRSLAQELGIASDEDEERAHEVAPLRAKQPTAPAHAAAAKKPGAKDMGKEQATGKGKAKATSASVPQANPRTRAGVALEKENVKRAKLSGPAGASGGSAKSSGSSSSSSSSSRDAKKGVASRSSTRTRAGTAAASAQAKAPPKGGARRVPAGSSQAASVPTWRG